MAVVLESKDRLCLLTLGTSKEECLSDVGSFTLVQRDSSEWLVYHSPNSSKELVVRDLATGDSRSFPGVMSYAFSKDNTALLLHSESQIDESTTQSLNWVPFPDGKPVELWRGAQGARASNFVFDAGGTQLAFAVQSTAAGQAVATFWHYGRGAQTAVLLADSRTPGIEPGFELGSIQRFTKDGRSLLFSLTKIRDHREPHPDAVKVDVWSYTDIKLQSQQLAELPQGPPAYAAVLHIDDRVIIRLQQEGDEEVRLPHEGRDDFALVAHNRGDHHEAHWNRAAQPVFYLVSTKDGARRRIDLPGDSLGSSRLTQFSASGRYVTALDKTTGDYLAYEVETGVIRNITKALPIPSDRDYDPAWVFAGPRGLEFAGFRFKDDEALLVYDKYDIWLVDPAGAKPPRNVTNGYGRRNGIQLRVVGRDYGFVARNDELLLVAFEQATKASGFYSTVLGDQGDPDLLLSPGPYTYDLTDKARDRDVYVVRRQSAAEAPNFFLTTDFKAFAPVSAIYPEEDYNWMRSRLVTWTTFDGKLAQGALYTPEDFDPDYAYPVIFDVYERKSDDLNVYKHPSPMDGGLPIPWFVSRGYLVFAPDIHYTMGELGASAFEFVVSAAEHLAQFPWIDSGRMGIQGHSQGGFETNYLITQTDLFAAAMSSSGFGNLVSYYGATQVEGIPWSQHWAEEGGGRIGGAPWEEPELYVENSPIFHVDRVTTPLLMMNNKDDGIVPFSQGVEFFTALRRQGKRVWMLQYDGEGHGLNPLANKARVAKDYTRRVTQFFDHYLKGAPAPRWMTEGLPARLKGVEAGLELELSGRVPGPGLVQEQPEVRDARRSSRN